MVTPQYKEIRRAYGFDEVAIVPGDVAPVVDMVMQLSRHPLSPNVMMR